MHPTAGWKHAFYFIGLVYFLMIDNQSIAVHAFAIRILKSYSGDEMLLPR